MSGPVGTTVTIGGSNFSTTPSNNIVYFGAVRAKVTLATSTFLEVTVPAGATYQPITVTVNSLTGYSYKPFIVTFLGAALQFTSQSFGNETHIDSVNSNTETTKYTIGDIDNDGKIDVITVDRLNNTMSVYRNTTTSGQISFASKVDFATAQSPRAVAVADIDGDGKLDVVVTNLSANTVSVFRNTSSLTAISFASKLDFTTATQPAGISVSDLDKDGKPDLVINTINMEGYVSVLRNTTSGSAISFATKIDLQSNGGSIENIATGDLDGDGKTDIAVPNYGLYAISIFRNTSAVGSISFAAKVDIPTGQYPDQLQIADLNDDAKLDLAVSYYLLNDNVSIFKNTSTAGSISFATALNYPTGNSTDGIAINDLDGDGKADMAVCGIFDSVSLFKNTSSSFGAISFAPVSKFATVWDGPIFTGDFDNDGKPDISLHGGFARVIIRKNKTTEPQITSFSPKSGGPGTIITITGQKLSGVTSVSFGGVAASSFTVVNTNTITAVVGAGASGDVAVTAFYGTAKLEGFTFTGTIITSFTPTTASNGSTVTIIGLNFIGTTAVSFGGTSASSFSIVNSTTITAVVGSGSSGNVSVTTPTGTASLAGFTFIPAPKITFFAPTSATAGAAITITGLNFTGTTAVNFGVTPAVSFTVNSPTSITAIVGGGSSGPVFVTTPNGVDSLAGFVYTYVPPPIITSFTPLASNIGSTVTISGNNFNTIASNNIVYFGATKATVNSATPSQITCLVPPGATHKPITVLNTANYLTGYSNLRHTETFTTVGTISNALFGAGVDLNTGVSTSPTDCSLSDIDGDGKADIISVSAFTSGSVVSVYRNISTTTTIAFDQKVDISGFVCKQLTLGDVDGDGKIDIIGATNGFSISVVRNTSTIGSISFAPKMDFQTCSGTQRVALGDIDGDGRPEIIVPNFSCTYISVLRNTSTAGNISFAPKRDFTMSTTAQCAVIGDLDGDGRSDIIVSNDSNICIFRNISTVGNIALLPKADFALPGNFLSHVYLADLDVDNKLDIVATNTGSLFSVFRNTSNSGNIQFTPSQNFDLGIGSRSGVLGDIDGDGKVDVAVSIDNGGSGFAVMKNTSTAGSISFGPKIMYTSYGGPWFMDIGDVDGDGKPELILPLPDWNRITILKNLIGKPTVTSFSPTVGGTGTTVSIIGTNFTGITAVNFGGVPVDSFVIDSSTAITAIIGSGASGYITVTNSEGTGTSSTAFTYYGSPAITSFTPTSGVPGTTVTITGTNFTGTTSVRFGGVSASSFTVVNSTTIKAVVGAGASGNVSVTTQGGSATMSGFTYIPPQPPTIISFTPVRGISGAIVTIIGTNLGGTTSVRFGGVAVSSFTVVSFTTITSIVSNGASGDVTVTTPGGTATLAGFTFVYPPTLSSFTPTSGGSGTTITITGTNFTGATAVSFGGTAATSYTVLSATTITAIIGTGTSGSVFVSGPGGNASLTGFTFISAPTITSFTPTTAAIGSTITITGTNFTSTTAVSFGGVAATSFTVVSPTTITAIVGTGSSGNVGLTTLGGTATRAGFTFISAPTITSFTPMNAGAGTAVSITGTNFAGTTAVSFGGIAATSFTVDSSTNITAVVAAGASGNVSVATPGGIAKLTGFTFIPAPTITSFSPTSAIAGTTVTITGTNFTGAKAVSFGGVAATSFTVVNSTSITAAVGTGASGDVSVTTYGGSASLPGFVFNFPTGLPGINGNSNVLIIYPNPSKNFIMVDHPAIPKTSSIRIIDMYGRLVKEFIVQPNEGKSQLNIQTLCFGVYKIVWSDEKNIRGGLFFKN
jgi:hypothetical protein